MLDSIVSLLLNIVSWRWRLFLRCLLLPKSRIQSLIILLHSLYGNGQLWVNRYCNSCLHFLWYINSKNMGNQGNTNSLWSKLQVRFCFCYLSWSQLLVIIIIFLCRQPEGCLQWHTTLTGRFQTFNFAETTTPQHLASQKCVKNYYLPSFFVQFFV